MEPTCTAPLAQLDRASGYEPEGREFESLRARHQFLLDPPLCVGFRLRAQTLACPEKLREAKCRMGPQNASSSNLSGRAIISFFRLTSFLTHGLPRCRTNDVQGTCRVAASCDCFARYSPLTGAIFKKTTATYLIQYADAATLEASF